VNMGGERRLIFDEGRFGAMYIKMRDEMGGV
jgi:hypothetical protein